MKYYICLELGGTNLRHGVVAEDLSLTRFNKIPSAGLAEADDKAGYLAALLRAEIDAVGRDNVLAVSLALSSLMDRDRTVIYSSPMVRGFDNLPLASLLEDALALPVFMEKDVNILLLYELSRLAEYRDGIAVGVFIGTGFGNAMCIDGKAYRGATGSACELGHIPVPGLDKLCGCGKPGCIELLTCGKVLHDLAENSLSCPIRDVFVQHGDHPEVLKILDYAAIAVATEITILDPEFLILGGGVTAMPGFPFERFDAAIRHNLRPPNPRDFLRIIRASGDDAAGVIGAGINARQRLER
ncbi:MAG: allose kinase [Planctomycetes bacterium]|nr:allose kinase [Planctomycetota bacterium]